MPGPKTHDISYKQLKKKLTSETLNSLPNYDSYNIFAQGHDFLIYHDFYKILKRYKLDENISTSILLQENNFQEFIYNYLKIAQEMEMLGEEQIKLFIGPGYIMHHLLDAYTHPLIIYYAGDHTPQKENGTWIHGCVESLIDLYMMEIIEKNSRKSYEVYKEFNLKKGVISPVLIEILGQSLKKTYNISRGGEMFHTSFYQLELFLRTLKCDRFGTKRKLFRIVNNVQIGASSLSYSRNYQKAIPFLNINKEMWCNPYDPSIQSHDSFLDLYRNALDKGACIINSLEEICQKGVINKDDIYSLIPNVNSVSGLKCNHEMKILRKKKWSEFPSLF